MIHPIPAVSLTAEHPGGWGIAIAAHAVSVYVGPEEITEAQIDRELKAGSGRNI